MSLEKKNPKSTKYLLQECLTNGQKDSFNISKKIEGVLQILISQMDMFLKVGVHKNTQTRQLDGNNNKAIYLSILFA